jgi:microcystin-dependent protein
MKCLLAITILLTAVLTGATGEISASLTPDYTPVGVITSFSADPSLMPAGYLLCDGSSFPPTLYPALFKIIGFSYVPAAVNASRLVAGPSNSYTFFVPDLRGVFPVGVGSNSVLQTSSRTLGSYDGAEMTTLTFANIPNHTHSAQTSIPTSIPSITAPYDPCLACTNGVYLSSTLHTHLITTDTTSWASKSSSFRTTPPAMGLHFIIKAGPAATPTPAPCPSMLPVPDASLNGTKVMASAPNYPAAAGSANPFVTDSAETCSAQCCAVPACVGYTFHASLLLLGTGGAPCFLWSNVNGYVPTVGYTSGVSASAFSASA